MKSSFFCLFLSVLFIQNSQAEDVKKCVTENCELYRQEEDKFKLRLKAIGCEGASDKRTSCDQVALASITKDYSLQMKSLFEIPNIKSSVKNDISFNSKTKLFSSRINNSEGVYDLIPLLDNPNIGVHWGAIENNQPKADRIINIDSNSPSVKDNPWYLTQWKKDTPLMLSESRKDPIITNSTYVDEYLGKPNFEIHAPTGKYGVETSLYIFKDPANGANVFEIVGRNGWINNVGGSNVFLSTSITNTTQNTFDSNISLSFNGKLNKMKAKYYDNSKAVRNEIVLGSVFAAFTVNNKSTNTNMFIQIAFGDTRGPIGAYRGCYMHGSNIEIVYTNNLDDDFLSAAEATKDPLKAKKYYLNKYLCDALSQNFSCPENFKRPDFQAMGKNLKDWTITGFYTGLETQVAKAKKEDQSTPEKTLGEIELGFQYSNMRITADTNEKLLNCEQVLSRTESPPTIEGCSRGRFKSGEQYIDFACGCGVVEGGVLQGDGCYHSVSADQTSPNSTPVPGPTPDKSVCSTGSFVSGGQTIEFSCGCGEVPGGKLQGDGCYHKISEISKPVIPSNPGDKQCAVGSFKTDSGQTIEYSCQCGVVAGAILQKDGCYHKVIK